MKGFFFSSHKHSADLAKTSYSSGSCKCIEEREKLPIRKRTYTHGRNNKNNRKKIINHNHTIYKARAKVCPRRDSAD